MHLANETADIFIPDGVPVPEALGRISHLGIGAHPDDLEFMAVHGILACYDRPDRRFGGVTCTHGGGSPRSGAFAGRGDDEMRAVRRKEQNEAAGIGRYAAMIQLDYAGSAVKDPLDARLEQDLAAILKAARPEVVYTHNPADKHDTHVAVFAAALRALRSLAPEDVPGRVFGCEVWRGLDWMKDDEKVVLDVGGDDELASKLGRVFASQIAGGKRYDLAAAGRRRANATFFESHEVDRSEQVCFAMDLTPLVRDPSMDATAYVLSFIDRFREDVRSRLERFNRGKPDPRHTGMESP